MMYKSIAVLIFCSILIQACQLPVKNDLMNSAEKMALEKEVRTTLDDYFEAIRKEGLEGEFTYLDSSASFFWVPPGYTSRLSFDSVATILRDRAPAYQQIDFQWEDLYVEAMSPDLVNYNGKVKGSMVDTLGQRSEVHLIETGLLIKRTDGWKLLSGQSAVIPN